MGKLGRFACIFTPMVLSFISLIMILLVFLGGTNKSDGNLRSIWFFSADTSQFKANSTNIAALLGKADDNTKKIIQGLVAQVQAKNLKDIYFIHMWNYCSGTKSGTNGSTVTIDYCSPRKSEYYFNPIVEWGLNGTIAQNVIPKGVDSALNAYDKAAKWLFIAYSISFWATVATIIVGFFAICSRIGSCLTTVVSGVATGFTILSAITSTVLFSTLVGALDALLKPYHINLTVGTKMLSIEWVGVAFSLAASLFWFISICCCSGRSSRSKDRNSRAPPAEPGFKPFANRGAAAYQPLGDEQHGVVDMHQSNPYHSQFGAPGAGIGQHEMQTFGGAQGPYKGRESAYEPYRTRDV